MLLPSGFQSENNGFADFHLYVCAAFLTRFSKDLLREKDFQVNYYKLQDAIPLSRTQFSNVNNFTRT